MTGRLYLYHVDKDPPDQDINLFVINTNRIIPGWTCVPGLSPSKKLLKKREQWIWDREWARNWTEFVKQYRQELNEPPQNIYVKHLLKRLNEGKNIAIACYCADERHCHKQIIGEWIMDRGIEVIHGKEVRRKRNASPHHDNDIVQLTIEAFGREGI